MIYRRLVTFAACLALLVIVAGAYVRLEDAGLGCPDWPGCYGRLLGVPDDAHEVAKAERAFPGQRVDTARAWKEMFHRYLAGALGLVIAGIAIMAWRGRRQTMRSPWLATVLVAVVAFQATLGMWTVTMLLKPAIVTLHLLGGMATLALLTWLALWEHEPAAPPAPIARRLRPWTVLALVVLAAQIALGGWVSANYAALACTDFPTCHGRWLPAMDFRHAFHVVRELGVTAAGAPLPQEALIAMHWAHRVGALATVLYLGVLAVVLWRMPAFRLYGALLAALTLGQAALGVANVLASLPLVVAVSHNGAAALLLAALVMLNFAVFQTPDRRDSRD